MSEITEIKFFEKYQSLLGCAITSPTFDEDYCTFLESKIHILDRISRDSLPTKGEYAKILYRTHGSTRTAVKEFFNSLNVQEQSVLALAIKQCPLQNTHVSASALKHFRRIFRDISIPTDNLNATGIPHQLETGLNLKLAHYLLHELHKIACPIEESMMPPVLIQPLKC